MRLALVVMGKLKKIKMGQSTITDWIQAIGVLIGIPVAIWSIISLFRKDKEKEKQLESLNSIAKSQDSVVLKLAEQVEQLTIQSSQFQYQNSLMVDSNKIMEKQLELQYEIFKHGQGVEEQKIEIVRKKRMSEIKPFFTTRSSMSSPDAFRFYLQNKGGDARKIKLINVESEFALFRPLGTNLNVDRDGQFDISGEPNRNNTYFNGNNLTFEINIEFEDVDGNNYFQNVKRLQNGKYIITDPEIIVKKQD